MDQQPSTARTGWHRLIRQLFADTREGLLYVWANPGLRSVIFVFGAINFCIQPFFILLPFYVKAAGYLHAPPEWTGYLFSSLAVGTTLGYWLPTLLPPRGKGMGWLMIFTYAVMGLGFGSLGLVQHKWTALCLMAGNGMLSGLSSNYVYSLLQTTTPAHLRGRVMSVLTALVMLVSPFAMGLAGVVADVLGQRLDLIFLTSGGLMTTGVLWGSLQKEFRGFMMGEGEADRRVG